MVSLTDTLESSRMAISPSANLNPSDRYMISKLDGFKAPYLEEKLLEKEIFTSQEEYLPAFTEFKKFAALGRMSPKRIAMTSTKVDEVWHQFILFTREYHNFCDEFLGGYLHHAPSTLSSPIPKNRIDGFRKAYTETFGEIPSIWDKAAVCSSNCDLGCAPCDTS